MFCNMSEGVAYRGRVDKGQEDGRMADSASPAVSGSASGSGTSTTASELPKYVVGTLVGCGFGIAFEKAKVCDPAIVREQMLLNKYIFLKFFLSAVASGMFALSMMAMLPATRPRFLKICNGFFSKLAVKGVVTSVLGGTLHGVGMTIAGSCPVTVFSQVGAMVPNAWYTFLGCLAGTFMYGVFKPAIDAVTKPDISESSNPWIESPYFVMALPLVAMFAILVCAFEILIPWTSEVQVTSGANVGPLARTAWPPYVSGALIGSLQLPLFLLLGYPLGGSSSFITMLSVVLVGPLKSLSSFICQYRTGFKSWWQVWYVCGAMAGGYLSAYSSGSLQSVTGVSMSHAFTGGAVMIIGARIAGGCTSGHGFTGLSFLSIMSFLVISSSFVGGIATAYIMDHLGMMKM